MELICNGTGPEISLSHQKLFPNLSLLSHYEFKKRFIKIMPNGDIQGGYAKMIISLIDFLSFGPSSLIDTQSKALLVTTRQACF